MYFVAKSSLYGPPGCALIPQRISFTTPACRLAAHSSLIRTHFKWLHYYNLAHVTIMYWRDHIWKTSACFGGYTDRDNSSRRRIADRYLIWLRWFHSAFFLLWRKTPPGACNRGFIALRAGEKARMTGWLTHHGDWWPCGDPARLMSTSVRLFSALLLGKIDIFFGLCYILKAKHYVFLLFV